MKMAGKTNHSKALTKLQALVRGYLVRRKFARLKVEYNKIVASIDRNDAKVTWRNDRKLCLPTVVDRCLNTGGNARVFFDNPGSKDTNESSLETGLTDFKNALEIKPSIQTTLGVHANTDCKLKDNICEKINSTASNGCLKNDLDSSWNSVDFERNELNSTMKREIGSTIMKGNDADKQQATVSEQMVYPNDKFSLIKLRHDLSMELLWIEQAIDSRVNYLKMKNNMRETETY